MVNLTFRMPGEVDKSWMFENDRFGKVYKDGVKKFHSIYIYIWSLENHSSLPMF